MEGFREEMKDMTRQEATQYTADMVGVVDGADIDWQQPLSAPCEECGGMVDLSSPIKVQLIEVADQSEVFTTMPEAEARQLLAEVGLPPPPVLCDKHERIEFEATLDA